MADVVTDLSRHERQSTVRLTTIGRKSGQKRTVTVWFVMADPQRFYVQHVRGADANWYRNLLAHPAVEVDFGSGVLPARAEPVADTTEVRRVLALFRKKYLLAWVFQLLGMTRQAVAAEVRVASTGA
jgi:deazaflavin-dependent oxidoreductase (nitroreductase family)